MECVELIGTHGRGLSNEPIPDYLPSSNPPNWWFEKFPFKIAANANGLNIDENVNRAHLRTYQLAAK